MKQPSSNELAKTERIKTFLKIKTSQTSDKSYFKISEDKKIFSLLDPISKSIDGQTQQYELDKIFTDQNEYSYIYEEICRDCITEALEKNIHFTFISSGDTNSEKNKIIFGGEDCYENINSRGIFPRLLEQLMNKINNNKTLSQNLSLSVSFLLINGNKIIDLSKFIGLNSKNLSILKEEDFISKKYSIDINNNFNIISNIKKFQVSNIKETLFFLSKLFGTLYKLDVDGLHLYTWSHFSFIIYLKDNNGKTISTFTFIILAGTEKINTMITNPKIQNKPPISNTKNILELTYTLEDIINHLNYQKINEEKGKTYSNSKLITVLGDISFNTNLTNTSPQRKFCVIGCIFPITGVHENVKNTLSFLFECKKIVRLRPNFTEDQLNELKNLKEDNQKEDIIFDLESKIKHQAKTIKELNERLDYKEKNINSIKENYKKQIECLKSAFNFHGDVNILLSNNEYTKESKYARSIREAMEYNTIYKKRISELEEKISKLKDEKDKILHLYDMQKNDEALIRIYTQIKEEKKQEENLLHMKNKHSKKIENLKDKNKILEDKIKYYIDENEKKFNIINNLPFLLKNNIDNNDKNFTDKEKLKNKMKNFYKKEIEEIGKNFQSENKIIIEKYENLLKQKNLEIKTKNNLIEDLNKKVQQNNGIYIDELIRIYDTFEDLIEKYNKCFDQRKFGSNVNNIKNFATFLNLKEEFDKTIDKNEKSVNRIQYPILFKNLDEKGIERKKTKIVVVKRKEDKKIEINSINKEHKKILSNDNFSVNEIETKKNSIFQNLNLKTDEDLSLLTKEETLNYIKKLHKNINEIDNFTNKYINYKKGFDIKEFEINNDLVHNLYEQISKYKNIIQEQTKKLNNNKACIGSHERMNEHLNSENFLLKKLLKEKQINEYISNPFKTSYNSKSSLKKNIVLPTSYNITNYNTNKNYTTYNRNNSNNIPTVPSSNSYYSNLITNSTKENFYKKSKTTRPLTTNKTRQNSNINPFYKIAE